MERSKNRTNHECSLCISRPGFGDHSSLLRRDSQRRGAGRPSCRYVDRCLRGCGGVEGVVTGSGGFGGLAECWVGELCWVEGVGFGRSVECTGEMVDGTRLA